LPFLFGYLMLAQPYRTNVLKLFEQHTKTACVVQIKQMT